MKRGNLLKILLSFLLIFTVLTPLSASKAEAATTLINKEFVTLAKKGQFKGAPGKVGLTFKSLQKSIKGKVEQSETSMLYRTKKATYGFAYDDSFTPKINSNQKVEIIALETTKKVTTTQMKRYFGKPVAYNAYKAGKYYIRNIDNDKYGTLMYIGTKKGINLMYSADPDGNLFIK